MEAEKLQDMIGSAVASRARAMHEDPKRGVRHIGEKLEKQLAPPLRCVTRDNERSDGERPGTIMTDPLQVDGVITRAWQRIYDGNVGDAARTVANFCAKYRSYLFFHEECSIE